MIDTQNRQQIKDRQEFEQFKSSNLAHANSDSLSSYEVQANNVGLNQVMV
jgi:hypothetical protein